MYASFPMIIELDESFIDQLLKEHTIPKQVGPLRFVDIEGRCANRGCSSSTFLRVQGVPRCMMHSLIELNEMLVGAGFQGI